MNQIKLAIIDDDALIVSLLNDLFKTIKEIQVVYIGANGDEFITYLNTNEAQVDLVLLDLVMKHKNGVELTELLKKSFPEIAIVIMSSHYKKSFIGYMLKSGVAAFIPKGVSQKNLVHIIKEVAQNGFYFLPEQVDSLKGQLANKTPKPKLSVKSDLTEREIEVLKSICNQKTSKEIGEELFISSRTVEGHKNNLFIKTGTKNLAGLVIFAIQNQIVDPSEILLLS